MPDNPSVPPPSRARPRVPALGDRLRERARALGLSNAAVARRAGIGVRQYQHYVAGERQPAPATLARIAAVLDTTADELIGGEWHGVEDRRAYRAERTIRDGLTDLEAADREVIADLVDTLRARRRQDRAAAAGLAAMAARQSPLEALALVHERLVPVLLREQRPTGLRTEVERFQGRRPELYIVLEFPRGTDLESVCENLRPMAPDTIGRAADIIPSPRDRVVVLRLALGTAAETPATATGSRPPG